MTVRRGVCHCSLQTQRYGPLTSLHALARQPLYRSEVGLSLLFPLKADNRNSQTGSDSQTVVRHFLSYEQVQELKLCCSYMKKITLKHVLNHSAQLEALTLFPCCCCNPWMKSLSDRGMYWCWITVHFFSGEGWRGGCSPGVCLALKSASYGKLPLTGIRGM